jgi:hypothetical protein
MRELLKRMKELQSAEAAAGSLGISVAVSANATRQAKGFMFPLASFFAG